MLNQHVTVIATTLRIAPPAVQTCWMLANRLNVRECMLTPSWGGAELGGKGSVHSYGKYRTIVYYMSIGMHTGYVGKRKCGIQKQACKKR